VCSAADDPTQYDIPEPQPPRVYRLAGDAPEEPVSERTVHITPMGVLASAFAELVKDAEDPKAWWRTSPLLAGTGLAYHLDQLGYEVVRKRDDDD
jgi:hypothetical protein